jgi:uncharacterized membrane protein
VALLIMLAFISGINSALAETIDVNAERENSGASVHVQVNMSLNLTNDQVFDVLNDYEHMPKFVTDLHAISLISSGINYKQVRIIGETSLLFFHFPIDIVMEVTNISSSHIALKSLQGNLGVDGHVDIKQEGNGTQVAYIADLRPSFGCRRWLVLMSLGYRLNINSGKKSLKCTEGMMPICPV